MHLTEIIWACGLSLARDWLSYTKFFIIFFR